MNYHDKVAKTVTLQKKAVTLEKKNNLMKDAVEKRLSTEERLLKENEDYVAELKDLSEKYSRAEVDVASLTATSSSLRIQLDQIESAHDKHILQLKQEYEAIISGNQASLQECQDNIVLLNGCVAELKSEKGDLAAKCVEGDSLLQKSQSLYSSLSSGFQSILSLAGISSSSALLESETAIHTVVSSFKNTFETMTASQQQSAELIDSLKAEKSILVGQGVQMRSEIEYLTDAVSVVQMEKTNLAEGASKDRQLFEEKETENKTALAQMAAQMVALNSSIQEKEDKIQTLSSTTMIASETTKKLKIDIEELDLKMSAERQQLNSKIDAQASNLLEKDGRIAQLESLLVQSGSEIDNLLQTKQDLENKYSSLESQLESAHKQLLATEQELTGNAQTLESQLKTQLCLVAELTSLTRGQDQELAASLDRINLLDQEVHDKTTRLESLVADLENVNREISTLQAANQDLMSIKINLESLLADKVAGIDSAASTIQDLSGKLDSAQLETATLLSQVDRLNVTCKVMSEDVSSLTQRLEESNQSNKHLEASLSSLESKLVESERQAQALAQDLKSESEAKCTLLTQFEELTTTSQQQKDSLEQTVSSLENIMSNRESQYRKSLEELNEKIDSDTVNFSQMRARLEMDLKEEKDRVSQLEADILDKEAVFTKTLLVERQRYASLEQTSLESCQDLQDKMDRDVTRFTTTITQLNEKIKENEVVVDALNKQVEETHSLTTAEITSLKEQLLQANAQFEEMVVAEKRKMDQTVCEYEQRVKAFESEVSSLQIASSDFKQSALTKEKEIQLLQERISLMQEETKQVEEARIYQLNELMASKQHADQRVLELETQTTQLDQTNCQLTSALEKKEVELVGMKGVLVGLESRLAQEIQQLTSEKQALIEKVSQQQQTMDKFSSNTKDLEEKLQDMSREREHSEKNSIALELKIKEFVEKLHVERETNKQTLSAYQSKYEEIALLLRKETERADKVEKERNATMEKLKFIQLTHSNEVGGRDIRIRSLEDQIKEKSKLLEARAAAFEETEKMRVEREEMLKEMEWARSRVQESEEKMAMIQTTWRNEKKDLEHEIERRRADIKGFTVDIEK